MSNELAIVETHQLESWDGAAERGLQARNQREQIIKSVLKKDLDFGVIPGTPKPTLLKAGAEKIADSLNLYPDYEVVSNVEDWDKPLFSYRYRCLLRFRGSGHVVATGVGSCNSLENRYRWRNVERKCPKCSNTAIIKGKEEYGGGWLCFKKKGGCGAKFEDNDESITSQSAGKVPNDDIYTQVNTIDKMAQKRSLVAAALNLGFSEQFTQDLEDMGHIHDEPKSAPVRQPKRKSESDSDESPFRGRLVAQEVKEGKKKNGEPWVLTTFETDNGLYLGTFSKTIAAELATFIGEQDVLTIHYNRTAKGGRNIERYEQEEQTEEVEQELGL
jgi:hypothetical protein